MRISIPWCHVDRCIVGAAFIVAKKFSADSALKSARYEK